VYLKSLLLLLIISLSGCWWNTKPDPEPQIVPQWRTYDCGVPPARDKVSFRLPDWSIIDSRYTLSTDGYADLGENMQEIVKAVGQLVETVRFYENCIKSAQGEVK